jgi:putative DNA primase/helicase
VGPTMASGDRPTLWRKTYFNYQDEEQRTLYRVVREDRPEGKQIRQERAAVDNPDPGNPKHWLRQAGCMKGARVLPYRLPELMAVNGADYVVVAEGEPCVEQLHSLGFLATCNLGGAGKWAEEYTRYLPPLPVVVLPDNDDPGERHAEQVARSVSSKATWVKVLRLPGLPPKGDVIDWLAAGGTAEELKRLIEQCARWTPHSRSMRLRPKVVRLDSVERKTVDWVWRGRIPKGMITILDGDPGIGKSSVIRFLAAAYSIGGWLPDHGDVPRSRTLLVAVGGQVRPGWPQPCMAPLRGSTRSWSRRRERITNQL